MVLANATARNEKVGCGDEEEIDVTHLVKHLDAAFNLAIWLVRNHSDAEDLVQEAYLRAVRSFHTLRGTDSRPWLLRIVRNVCYDWLRRKGNRPLRESPVEEMDAFASFDLSAEAMLLAEGDTQTLQDALEKLPLYLREVVILRELEELPYKDIAALSGVPKGTVMSRLSRARKYMERWYESQDRFRPMASGRKS